MRSERRVFGVPHRTRREAINEPLFSLTYHRDYAASVAQARTQLGEEVYALRMVEGHAMSPEQAIALALGE